MSTLREEKGSSQKETGKIPKKASQPVSTQLVSFGERVTYTFSTGREVGSIHYDRMRSEIFYKGHNVRYMDLEPGPMQMLEKMRTILLQDQATNKFAESYGQVLDKIIFEKSKTRRSSP